ncbi:MAG: helix-turn-helix transcriptional regulator [Firmicutes bacterium]|nr:helix-turn-helix transcriptional regulator [Bacillota bacterium]
MMIKLRVQEILDEKGKTRYWLAKETGYSYQNICNIVGNKTKQIRFETLELFCSVLGCSVKDLFQETDN